MNRRELMALLAGTGINLPSPAQAQQLQKVPTIGLLHPGFPEPGAPTIGSADEVIE